ncbi:triose-phosphate isomerase [Limoniibacter endophyticus]|uniref:Triosephosphate isomerase n=1 Tax=Limoniibacter endophyticus TaxID=1565040 RepID=A0A8J3DEJ0_9HYPH|nr:triose-phosphate isomerase [Limoniibacter endophyticus]GHC60932.1 triosephosphate isomerase [Limoniibacter endophyticus]
MSIRPLVAGNWKMHGTSVDLEQLVLMGEGFESASGGNADAAICLPATLLARGADKVASGRVKLGGQDCHFNEKGAHTGDISAQMLKDAGAEYVIVGHSERRTDHGETSEIIRAKAEAAWAAGLVAIICIGETKEERGAGKTLDILTEQLKGSVPAGASAQNTVIAYEPVWAIGTGLTPSLDDVAQAHAHIRATLAEIMEAGATATRILYGGSVKPSNAAELMAVENVDGALIGGASLKAEDFLEIAKAYK